MFDTQPMQENVRAVERRWERDAARRRSIEAANRRLALCKVLAFSFAMLGIGIALIFILPRFGVAMPVLDSLFTLKLGIPAVDSNGKGPDFERLAHYAKVIGYFKSGKPARWRDAPESIKPKSAAADTKWYALVIGKAHEFDVYEMTSDGAGHMAIKHMSPVCQSISVSMKNFKANCEGRSCFIAHDGVVYACGGIPVDEVERLREML